MEEQIEQQMGVDGEGVDREGVQIRIDGEGVQIQIDGERVQIDEQSK